MTDSASVTDCALVSTTSAKENIARALRLHMGQGREYSVDDVAEATGISSPALYSYIRQDDRRTPTGDTLIRLMQFFGPAFAGKVFGGTGMGAHWLQPRPGSPGYVIAKLAKGTGEFAWRGADHVYCNNDKGALTVVADDMIQILTPFSSRVPE